MRFAKKAAAFIGLIMIFTILAGCAPSEEFSDKETKYYVAYSKMFTFNGELCGIDEDGNFTSRSKVRLCAGTKLDFINGKKLIGGSRANSHLIVDGEGNYKEFYLLDDPMYTGVCAITMNGDRIVASMNGGASNGVYLNYFVVQNLSGDVEIEKAIEIYGWDIICSDDIAYIVGTMESASEEGLIRTAKIIAYNLTSGEMNEQLYEAQKSIESVCVLNGKLYCAVSVVNGRANEIYVIDPKTLEKTDTFEYSGGIEGLLNYEDKLYCGIGNKFCLISSEESAVLEELYELPQNSYIEDTAASNGHIYITVRFNKPDKENSIYGTQIDYDLSAKTYVETPIHLNSQKYGFFVVCPTSN